MKRVWKLRVGLICALFLAVTLEPGTVLTGTAFQRVVVGQGLVDASVRQVIRTASDRVYIFAADDTAQRQSTAPGVIRAWKANQPGIPTAFFEMDTANRPSATGNSRVLGSPDVRLDVNGIVHLLYVNEANGTLVYQTFSTLTDIWGSPQTVATGVKVPTSFIKRGETANALILDRNEVPHIVYIAGSSVLYRNKIGGTWSAPITLAGGGVPLHPQLAFDLVGNIHLTWLDDGSPRVINYKQRASDGTWGAPEVVANTDVLANSTLDQGPSIIVTQSGTPYILYVSASASAVRVKYKSGTNWLFDNFPTNLYTHTPQIYGRENDIYVFLGHDINLHYGYIYHLSSQPWSNYIELSIDDTDGSASVRWDLQRDNNPNIIDTVYFNEDKLGDKSYLPELYYMAIVPSTAGQSDATPPAAPTNLRVQ